jgi:eukaryotic-like serine/threonine-protein kinase
LIATLKISIQSELHCTDCSSTRLNERDENLREPESYQREIHLEQTLYFAILEPTLQSCAFITHAHQPVFGRLPSVAIPGTVLLERYRIVRPFARGASSVVYLAFDQFGTPYAVKLFPVELASRADREYLVGSQLRHRNVNPILERVTVEGQPGLLMPFAPGKRFSEWVGEHGLQKFLEVFVQVLDGLAHVHARGFVHRDIKPENVVVSPGDGPGGLEAKLIDFDLSGPPNEVFRDRVTAGTVAYLSPEAVRGLPLTISTDLYSAGVMLYWGLTGQLPFDGDPQQVMRAHLSSPPPEPASLRASKSAHVLDKVAMRLLEKDPARRYADALAVLTELSKLTSISDR